MNSSYLKQNIDENGEKRVGQVEYEPDLHWLDVRGGGEAARDWEVDGGQHHHAGCVDFVDHAVLVGALDVVGGLVHHVYQDGGQVCHHEYTQKFSRNS